MAGKDLKPSNAQEETSGTIESFEDLLAWKLAFELATRVYKITKDFPEEERFGLTTQLRRSASSISANIAEGFGRHTPKEYLRFLVFARGSIAETQSHLQLAQAVGYLKEKEFVSLQDLCLQARKTLQGLIRYIRKRAEADRIAEPLGSYSELLTFNSEPELTE